MVNNNKKVNNGTKRVHWKRVHTYLCTLFPTFSEAQTTDRKINRIKADHVFILVWTTYRQGRILIPTYNVLWSHKTKTSARKRLKRKSLVYRLFCVRLIYLKSLFPNIYENVKINLRWHFMWIRYVETFKCQGLFINSRFISS